MKTVLASFVALVLCLGGPTRAGDLSPRAFTEAAAAAARAAMPSATIRIVTDLQVETRATDGKTTSTDLRNAYQVYLRDPTRFEEVIERYVSVLVETVRLGDPKGIVDHSRIVPVLKTQQWLEGVRKERGATGAPELLTDPFNNEMTIVYAEDRSRSVRYLMARDDVGDRAKLHDLAIENLSHILPKVEMHAGSDNIWQVTAGGDYEASLLVADGLWSSGQIKVDGEIVVAVPGKDALFVTGSHNRAGIERLRALAADLAKGPYALTPVLFVYRGDKFVRFENR